MRVYVYIDVRLLDKCVPPCSAMNQLDCATTAAARRFVRRRRRTHKIVLWRLLGLSTAGGNRPRRHADSLSSCNTPRYSLNRTQRSNHAQLHRTRLPPIAILQLQQPRRARERTADVTVLFSLQQLTFTFRHPANVTRPSVLTRSHYRSINSATWSYAEEKQRRRLLTMVAEHRMLPFKAVAQAIKSIN